MARTVRRLLIVEDEPLIRSTLTAIFVQLGHDVDCAEDGFSALEKIRQRKPDIILSDLNMPGMSGFELLSVVRRRLPSIYVIATSGAYSGAGIPCGIAADAFYEKATCFRVLVDLLNTASQAIEPPSRLESEPPPAWISKLAECPEETVDLIITCPECLRNSTAIAANAPWKIHKTHCIYCSTPIHYAIIRPMDSVTSMANQPGLRPETVSIVTEPSVQLLQCR